MGVSRIIIIIIIKIGDYLSEKFLQNSFSEFLLQQDHCKNKILQLKFSTHPLIPPRFISFSIFWRYVDKE
jgi:hypothetical protein